MGISPGNSGVTKPMKTTLLSIVLSLLTLPALASPPLPPDVPPGFWAAGAVRRVAAAKLMTPDAQGKFDGSKPVTRYELAVVLDRLVRDMEAAHKPLSAAPPSHVTLPKGTPHDAAAALKHLVGNGFLPKDSALLTQPGTQPVTARETADALSEVTIRLSDRSLPPQQD